jgi:C4-dicarboxylate-specific signal transduction histidine kinase
VLKFYAAIPIILLAMILLTASLRRGHRALKAEISRRADAETALIEVNALLEMRLIERTEAAELRAQYQVLSERIAAMDRQRSLGQMSATLAHEINQPLTAIKTAAQALLRSLDVPGFDQHKQVKMAEKIVFNVRRAAEIISKIRNFIKPAEATMQPIDIDVVVRDVVDLLKHDAMTHRAEVRVQNANAPAVVMGDALQLSQVVVNLLRNAFEAMANSQERVVQVRSLVEGKDLVLTVQDSGPGFSSDILPVAGTPYFTSKVAGLGIGLSISRDIVSMHGGTLNIANSESGGALMEIRLPLGYSAS